MDRFVLSICLCLVGFLSQSQTRHPLHLSIREGSNWTIKVDSIPKELFDKTRTLRYRENRINKDSLLRAKTEEFPDRIVWIDSCLILKSIDGDIRLCNHKPKDEKAWTGFEAYGVTKDYLVVMQSGYESWSYISFNTTTRKSFHTSNEPIFIDNGLIYSYGNYYSHGQFQVIDTNRDRHFGFDTFDWELIALYHDKASFFLEFTPKWGPKEYKYLRLDYK